MKEGEKVDLIQEIYETLRSMGEHLQQKGRDTRLVDLVTKYYELAHQGMIRKRPISWYFSGVPVEIFRAMDFVAFSPEYTCGILAAFRGSPGLKYLDIASVHVTEQFCAVNKFPAGLLLSGDTATPDMIISAASQPCDAGKVIYSNINYCLDIPSFYIDMPYLPDKRSQKYVAGEFRKMISFIEEQSKQKLDWDWLRDVIGYSNQAYKYAGQLDELRKNIPCPVSGRVAHGSNNAMAALAGTPECAEWFREEYELAEGKVQRGEGAIPNEKVRLVWSASPVDFDPGIFEWLERTYGAATVAVLFDMFPTAPIDNTGDEARILEGLAMKMLGFPMARHGRGPVDLYIDDCISVARDYKADAVIYSGNTGCKWGWAAAQLLKDKTYDELGIPTLSFELCPWDPRVVSSESIKGKFEQFFELIM